MARLRNNHAAGSVPCSRLKAAPSAAKELSGTPHPAGRVPVCICTGHRVLVDHIHCGHENGLACDVVIRGVKPCQALRQRSGERPCKHNFLI